MLTPNERRALKIYDRLLRHWAICGMVRGLHEEEKSIANEIAAAIRSFKEESAERRTGK